MRLLIIRHGESEADILNVHEGRADFELTDYGHKEAEAMAQYVSERFKINKIIASPLKRAAQAADHLSRATGIKESFDDRLMEFNNGLLAGLSHEEAARLYPEHKLPVDQSEYGMESQLEFLNRVADFYQELIAAGKKEDVVALVTHGGTINKLYMSMLGLPADASIAFGTADTGIHVWDVTPSRTLILCANQTGHLRNITK